MKITEVKGFPVRLTYRNLFIVKVETDTGADHQWNEKSG